MAFKDFSTYSSAMDNLQRQLDVNALFVRVINRVSNLISNAQNIPSQYTAKYNQVQLLQYDADGQLQDVTPDNQLSIPNSVLLDRVANIKSSQRLIESDLEVVDEAASQPLKVSTAYKSRAGIENTDLVPICFPTAYGLLNQSTGFVDDIITHQGGLHFLSFLPDEVECRMVDKDRDEYPIYLTIDECSWFNNDLSCVHLKPKAGNSGAGFDIIIRVIPALSKVDRAWREVGTILGTSTNNAVLQGGCLEIRLMDGDEDHSGFVSSSTSLISFDTKDPGILYGLRNSIQRDPKYPLLESSSGAGLLSDIFYPKSAIDQLAASLKP